MPVAALGAAAGGAGIGLLAGGAAAATGAGKSKYAARNFKDTPYYDANRYEFGGRAGAADEMAGMERSRGQGYDASSHGYMAEGFDDRQRALQARQGQMTAADQLASRAAGNDLISTRVANQARTGIIGDAASNAAGARGAAGLALAQQGAQNAASSGLASTAANEMIAGSQEQLANTNAALGAYGNIRQGDDASRNASLSAAGQMGQLGLGYTGAENQTRATQMQGNLAEQQNVSGSLNQQQQIDSTTQQNNANRDMDYVKMAFGGASGGLQSGAQLAGGSGGGGGTGGGGGKARGGPVKAGRPYIVGEEGPELIVPQKDGFVFTAPQTKAIVSDPFAKMGIGLLGGGGPSATSGPGEASAYKLTNDGGMDVNATMKANNDLATQFARDGSSGGYASDPYAKAEVLPLSDLPDGRRLQIGDSGHAYYAMNDNASDGRPSLSGPAPRYSSVREEAVAAEPKRAPKVERKKTPEEMMKEAEALLASMKAQHEASLAEGPAARRLASGSRDNGYETELTQGAEKAFRGKYGDNADTSDYDLRGAFAGHATDGQKFERATDGSGGVYFPGHLPDTWKKPDHETFSVESQYAKDAPERAGRWEGDRYVAASDPKTKTGTKPLSKEEQAKDDEEIAKFLGPNDPSKVRYTRDTNQTPEQAAWEQQRAEYEKREGERVERVAREEAAKRQQKLDQEAAEAAYQNDRGTFGVGPVLAGVKKALGGYEKPSPERVENGKNFAAWLAEKQKAADALARKVLPESVTRAVGQSPVLGGGQRYADGTARYPERSPVSFERGPVSDPRAKKLGGVHNNEVSKTLDETPAVSYRYKSAYFEPTAQHPGQRQAGFLTTDLKKTPLGAAVVEMRDDGYEGYNPHRMIGLQHAEIRNVHERLRDLEAMVAKAKKGGR